MLTWIVRLKKCIHVKVILKNVIQRKQTKHAPSGYSLFTNCSFDLTKNKFDCYYGKDCIQGFVKT